jgi:hypothetical protein
MIRVFSGNRFKSFLKEHPHRKKKISPLRGILKFHPENPALCTALYPYPFLQRKHPQGGFRKHRHCGANYITTLGPCLGVTVHTASYEKPCFI